MRVFYILLAITIIPLSLSSGAFSTTSASNIDNNESTIYLAHSGRTDRYGCHNDRKRGTYHCH